MKKFFIYGICTLNIILGIFASIQLFEVFTAESRTYGGPKYIHEEFVEVLTYSYNTPFYNIKDGEYYYEVPDLAKLAENVVNSGWKPKPQ